MDTVKMEKQRKLLIKTKDDILYEKKQLMEDFEKLKDIVMKSGLVSLICALLQGIFVGQLLKSKSVVLLGLGRYLTPFVLAIFVLSIVIFVIKGFDLFVNSDTDLSRKAAKKFEKTTYTDKISSLNDSIIRIDIELEKIEKNLYGTDEDMSGLVGIDYAPYIVEKVADEPEYIEKIVSDKELNTEPKKETAYTKETESIIKALEENEVEIEFKKDTNTFKQREESIDDILNALDSWGLSDDDDDFENSSELWKRDSKSMS